MILDEPTNHLDIGSREALEEALSGYDGTIFIVSHDRYFINRMASKVLRLTEDGCEVFAGNYEYYVERFREKNQPVPEEKPQKENSYKARKEQESARRKRQTRIRRTEEDITAAEEAIAALHQELNSEEVAADYARVLELTNALDEKSRELDTLMALWETLQLEVEADETDETS